jgi:hypothetical protein
MIQTTGGLVRLCIIRIDLQYISIACRSIGSIFQSSVCDGEIIVGLSPLERQVLTSTDLQGLLVGRDGLGQQLYALRSVCPTLLLS